MLFFPRYLRLSLNHFGLFYFIFANTQRYYVRFHNRYLRFYLSRLCEVFRTTLCYHVASSKFILTQFETWECIFLAIFFLLTKNPTPVESREYLARLISWFLHDKSVNWSICSVYFPTYPSFPKLTKFICQGRASKWECIIINSLIKLNVMQASELWLVTTVISNNCD